MILQIFSCEERSYMQNFQTHCWYITTRTNLDEDFLIRSFKTFQHIADKSPHVPFLMRTFSSKDSWQPLGLIFFRRTDRDAKSKQRKKMQKDLGPKEEGAMIADDNRKDGTTQHPWQERKIRSKMLRAGQTSTCDNRQDLSVIIKPCSRIELP